MYLKQYSLDDGKMLLDRKTNKSDSLRLFLRYYNHGFNFRCWCCGRIANTIIARKDIFNADGNRTDQAPYLSVACIDNTGIRIFGVDHILPRHFGRPNKMTNYRPSCAECNVARSSKMTIDEIEFGRILLNNSSAFTKTIVTKRHPIMVEFVEVKYSDWNDRVVKILQKETQNAC